MREVVAEAIDRGALGFSTSRTLVHKTPDGEPIPGTFALPEELLGIARALQQHQNGVFEVVPYLDAADPEDRNGDQDGDGYTNLEEYLNSLCARDKQPSAR